MRRFIIHAFVFATAIAAFVHSSWSLGTMFAGNEPATFSWQWVAWFIPAGLIAFSLDIGQVSTSIEIRNGARTRAKYITFFVFSVATYFLQWLYIAHHMPLVDLSPGIRDDWRGISMLVRDASLWIIPAFLPLSTLLYTFSHGDTPALQPEVKREGTTVNIETMNVMRAEHALHDNTPPALPDVTPPDEVQTTSEIIVAQSSNGERIAAWFDDAANVATVRAMKQGKVSQAKVAAMIGVQPSTLSRYLSKRGR